MKRKRRVGLGKSDRNRSRRVAEEENNFFQKKQKKLHLLHLLKRTFSFLSSWNIWMLEMDEFLLDDAHSFQMSSLLSSFFSPFYLLLPFLFSSLLLFSFSFFLCLFPFSFTSHSCLWREELCLPFSLSMEKEKSEKEETQLKKLLIIMILERG